MSRHSVDADTPMLMDDLSWVVLLDKCTHDWACAFEPVPSSLCLQACLCLRACAIKPVLSSLPVPSSLCHWACAIDRWCYRLWRSQWRMIMKMMMIPSSTRWKLEMTSVADEPNLFAAAISNRSHLSMAMRSSMTYDYTLCEVFESMDSIALRAQTDVGLFWRRTYTLLMMIRRGWEYTFG